MSMSNSIRDLINETAFQQQRDTAKIREESSKEGPRNVGDIMGKHDFLMLLSAQLRFQDPLNPQSDADFASQLAQFSSLEQMQNMNETLGAMSNYQAFSLVGKYVIAVAHVEHNGRMQLMEIPGVVDSVFTRDGITFAHVAGYDVPISTITDVFDSNSMITSDMLIQTSNNLLGRTVKAYVGNPLTGKIEQFEGTVTRITVDGGRMFALVVDSEGVTRFVPVSGIYDIREAGTPGDDELSQSKAPGETDPTAEDETTDSTVEGETTDLPDNPEL